MADLFSHITRILCETDPNEKAIQTRSLVKMWMNDGLEVAAPEQETAIPLQPGRPENLQLVAPGAVPRRKIGTLEGRIALLHAIAHIELNAIDLALDIIVRFAISSQLPDQFRNDFINDWLEVAADEARHFLMIEERLVQLGSHYGALSAHQGLWEAALNTRDHVLARLAIAPMLLEARGLDVTPSMIEKLQSTGDKTSANILNVIYQEEIGHVAKGVHWFNRLCKSNQIEPKSHFQKLVKERLPAGLRPPFNHEARQKAGLNDGYYLFSHP